MTIEIVVVLSLALAWVSIPFAFWRSISREPRISVHDRISPAGELIRRSDKDLSELEFSPAPGGELEWAYGLLERARKEEEQARREEQRARLRRKCEKMGHVSGPEITTWGNALRVYVCPRCGEIYEGET